MEERSLGSNQHFIHLISSILFTKDILIDIPGSFTQNCICLRVISPQINVVVILFYSSDLEMMSC